MADPVPPPSPPTNKGRKSLVAVAPSAALQSPIHARRVDDEQPFRNVEDDAIEVYTELNIEFDTLLRGLAVNDFVNTIGGNLNNIVSNTGHRGGNHHKQFLAVVPTTASFICWLMTSGSHAPGNPHVENMDYHGDGHNNHTFNYVQSDQMLNAIVSAVRSLLVYSEVQTRMAAGPNHHYVKFMAIVDRQHDMTFLIRIHWSRTAATDDLAVTIRQFGRAPVVQPLNHDVLVSRVAALGFK